MVKKARAIPLRILVLEALLRRLPIDHPGRGTIEADLIRRKAGFKGERSPDYFMRHLPFNGHYIFQDLRLPLSDNVFFQIDSLLLSNRYFIIYDDKHYSGTLTFEEQQMLRTYENLQEAFPNPIVQVENQQYHLGSLIRNHLNITLPNTSFVVITNPSTIIRFDPKYEHVASQKVIRPTVVRQKSELFWREQQKPFFSDSDFQQLSRLLLKLDTPLISDALGEFKVSVNDIIPGILCNICSTFTMERKNGSWVCTNCGNPDKRAHIQALIDYFLVVANTITNQQLRQYLRIPSISVASKLLSSLNLPYEGTYRNRVYILSLEKLEKCL